MLNKHVSLFIISIISTFFIYGQDPYCNYITTSDGLPSNTVYDIFQDSKGFMWFGTDEGICRYDGKYYQMYHSSNYSITSASCIKEDKNGRIWYMSLDNIIYYIENGILKKLNQSKPLGTFSKFHVMDNWILIPQLKGVDVFDVHTLNLVKTIPIYDSDKFISSTGNKSYFYFQTADHIYKINNTLNITKLPTNEFQIVASQDTALYFIDNSTGVKKYYTYNNHGYEEYIVKTNAIIKNICFTPKTDWICTTKGLYRKNNQEIQAYFQDKYISSIYLDKSNNYWISTINDGVIFAPSLDNKLFKFQSNPQKIQLFNNEMLFGGKENVIYNFNLNTNLLTKKVINENLHEIVNFSYDTINKTMIIASDILYVYKNKKLSHTIKVAAKDIVKVDNKYYAVAISGASGLFSLNNELKSKWDSIYYSNVKKNGILSILLPNIRGKSTAFDSNNNTIYFSGNTGLFAVTPYSITEVKHNGNPIYSKYIEWYDDYLFVLQDKGIILTIHENKIKEYPLFIRQEYIPIRKIVLRKNYLFLISNGRGIYSINLNNPINSFRQIENILLNDQVYDIELWENKYIIASSKGLLLIDTNDLKSSAIVPPFIINSIKVNNQPVDLNKEHKFKYYQNNIRIDYSILSYLSNKDFRLYYRINNNNWTLTSQHTRELELAFLQPGEYVIDFRYELSEKTIHSIKFNIAKPIWAIYWFWLIIGGLLFTIVFLILRVRIKALHHRNTLLIEKIELEKNLNKSTLTSIKAQMNPHFYHNALNTIQFFIYSDDKKNASKYLSKFSKLSRLILEMSEKEEISISEEILALNLYLDIEKARFNDKFIFNINIDEHINQEMVKIPPMIIQPYIENAIKHGLLHKKVECKLTISFSIVDQNLQIIIDDNGIGRVKSSELNKIKKQHESFSSMANQKRLEILNMGKNKVAVKYIDKYDETGIASGTTVIILLPMNKKYE